MVHIVSHFGSGDLGPSLEVICTMRIVEKRMQTKPEQKSMPTPILRLRGIFKGITRRNGKNMTDFKSVEKYRDRRRAIPMRLVSASTANA